MNRSTAKINLGILGCGAIGSRIAQSTRKELKDAYRVTGLYDINHAKSASLARALKKPALAKKSVNAVLKTSDLIAEAVNTPDARQLVGAALKAQKNVLVMSVGQLFQAQNLFARARKNRRHLLIPSGAIAGIDALKSTCLADVSKIVLTTRKSPGGFKGLPLLAEKGIDIYRIDKEMVLFDGSVEEAVRHFPKNINVAATLALASGDPEKIKVRILTSPAYTSNSHEIEITSAAGNILTRTQNTICPDNPKTSYLAVLSAIRTLKDFASTIKIGT